MNAFAVKDGGGRLDRAAILGPGLIGGSVALALRSRCPSINITVWGRREEQLLEIQRQGIADAVTADMKGAVMDADLVVLCTPIGIMNELAQRLAPHLAEGAVVTDAGSVKVSVVEQLTPILGERFVGAHPMAGSELSGFDAARADLFAGAPCILTPLPTTPIRMLEAVSQFWSSLGAQVTTMSPVEHDRLVARISHLPHAIAFALVNLVAATLPPSSSQLAGGSFRDGTRVAASDPALWTGILSENRVEVIEAIREMSDLLQTLAGNLEAQEKDSVLDFLSQAKEHRGTLPLPTPDEIL